MQNRDKLDSISAALQLNDHNKNVLFSMTDKYKDVYIQFKDSGVVLQIDTDEYSLGLYSSDPDHKKWLRQDLERTQSLPVTLENFANHFTKNKTHPV
jgi:phosphatidylinositol kinase/protein kinase (PI-3  family)